MTLPKMTRKRYLYIGLVVVGVFLFFRYWDSIAGFIGSLYQALIPLVLGALAAYIINILMSFYERHYFTKKNPKFAQKSRKAVCLILAILTILVIVGLIIGLIVPQLISCAKLMIQKIPATVKFVANNEKIASFLPDALNAKVQEYAKRILELDWSKIAEKVMGFLKTGLAANKGKITTILSSTASVIVSVIVGIIFSIYYLVCKEQILRNIKRISDNYIHFKWKAKAVKMIHSFNKIFHKYIVAECIEAVILGLLCLAGMTILRLPYAPMISALVMLMALIPIVGSTISAVVGTLMILSVSPLKALIFFIMLMVIQVIEGNVIYPKVVGKGVGTPGIIVLGAVTVGGSVFGVAGMLLSVPVVTTIWNEMKQNMEAREKSSGELPQADK